MPNTKFKRIEDLFEERDATMVVPAEVAEAPAVSAPPLPPVPKTVSAVRAARQALLDDALDTYDKIKAVIAQAVAAQQYDIALENLKWLIDHTPADEDGQRVIEGSVDRKQVEQQGGAPTIQIGFNLGGVSQPKALPSTTVIDVTPEKK